MLLMLLIKILNGTEHVCLLQHQGSLAANGNKAYASFEYKSGFDSGRNASSSDRESQ